MIPGDLAARLRMLTEASFFDSEPPIQGPARVREIQARLPELVPGERFTATLQRALPDGTFQAIVAGRSYTLALNRPAISGDTVELVVTKHTGNTIFAQSAEAGVESPANPQFDATRPALSPVGRLIGFVLTGQPAAKPVELAAGKPLLAAPPAQGAGTLAPALQQAVSRSGLFYESHQSLWLAGRFPTRALMQEPQGQTPPPRADALPPTRTEASPAAPGVAAQPLPPTASGAQIIPLPANTLAQNIMAALLGQQAPSVEGNEVGPQATAPGESPQGEAEPAAPGNRPPAPLAAPRTVQEYGRSLPPVEQGAAEATGGDEALSTPGTVARPTMIPERLVPVVHQQLDAMATQTYVWHGQVWPGQMMEWEINDPEQEAREEDGDPPQEWNTTLRLQLPRLGNLEARLVLSPAGVALRLLADDPPTVEALTTARSALESALEAADVPLTGFVAEQRNDNG